MSKSHGCELEEGLARQRHETPMQWTEEVPRQPGWYWLRHAVLRHESGTCHELYAAMVEVRRDRDGNLYVYYMPALHTPRSLADLVVGEWAGPLTPPA
jgi:hypothetical protein